jgi:hypothetical protein
VAGDERAALLKIVRQIGCELRRSPRVSGPTGVPSFGSNACCPTAAILSPREERFVAAMRLALAELACDAGAGSLKGASERMVVAALEGTELVVRGQLAMGSPQKLRVLLPSFIFLITLPIVEQDDALAISGRAVDLIEQTFGPA